MKMHIISTHDRVNAILSISNTITSYLFTSTYYLLVSLASYLFTIGERGSTSQLMVTGISTGGFS